MEGLVASVVAVVVAVVAALPGLCLGGLPQLLALQLWM